MVATSPAPLAGMGFPQSVDWDELHRKGYRRVLRLHPGAYDPSPLTAHELLLEDLYGGRLPSDPQAERERVLEAARVTADWIGNGEGVVVHCLGGTGRTGTVLACALRHLGLDADDACRATRRHLPNWPESAWQEEVVRSL
jgi:Tyrosine phosphatase family